MPTPTTSIDALPDAATPINDSDLLIIQQSGITKKVPAAFVGTGGSSGGGGGGGSVMPGDHGDITVDPTGQIWMFDSTVVTSAARGLLNDPTVADMKITLGLNNVTNTTDLGKPVSTATQTALNGKVNALNGLVAVWKGTAAEYAAIGTKDSNTLYCVTA